MKKLAIAALIGLTITSAHALEVGVEGGRSFSSTDLDAGKLTVGTPMTLPLVGKVTASAEYTYARKDGGGYDGYSAAVTKQVVSFGPVAVGVRGSVGYADVVRGDSGGMLGLGVVCSMPLTKSVDLVGGVEQRWGQSRVSDVDGTLVSAGLRVKF